MRRAVSAVVTATLLVLGAGVALAPGAAATLDSVARVPMSRADAIVADEANDRIYLAATGIDVRTMSGTAVATLSGYSWIADLELSPDAATLWVLSDNPRVISSIDTTTLAETARYPLPDGACPLAIAPAATLLWFAYSCVTPNVPDLGAIDLTQDPPAVLLGRTGGTLPTYVDRLATSPAQPDRLVASGSGGSYVLTLDGATAAVTATGPPLGRFELSGDGARVATYTHEGFPVYRASDLTLERTHPKFGDNTNPNAVAITASGFVVAGVHSSYFERDIRVYAPDGRIVRSHDLGYLSQNGLAVTRSGDRMLALMSNGDGLLYVIHDPEKLGSSVSLTAPAAARVRTAFTVKGRISTATPIAAGTKVHVIRSSEWGRVTLPDVAAAADGTFAVTDTVGKRGFYTYTAHWDGDETRGSAGSARGFKVLGLVPPLTLKTSRAVYDYGQTAGILAHLGTGPANRTVRISAQRRTQTWETVLRNAPVSSAGNLGATFVMTQRTTFRATFPGDAVYEPHTVSVTALARALLSQTLSGHYATSGAYHLYRTSADPVLTVRTTPRLSGCMAFYSERYTSGAWRPIHQDLCFELRDGLAGAIYVGTPTVGAPYRIRARYGGDTKFTATYGAWKYFRFT